MTTDIYLRFARRASGRGRMNPNFRNFETEVASIYGVTTRGSFRAAPELIQNAVAIKQ